MDAQELQMRRMERARARRQRRLRRRIGAFTTLAAAIAAIAVAVALASSGGAKPPHHLRAASNSGAAKASSSSTAHGRTLHGSTAATLGPATGRPGTASVPVLMYHVIAPPPAGAPYPGLYVDPDQFAAQMHALKAAGWRAVTLDQLYAYWKDGARLPPGKPIVVTFDNGYHSQYSAALPVMRQLGWPADENIQLTGLPPSQGGMTTAEVRALVDAGWELDTQGMSHADLATADASQLRYQVVTARRLLRRRYGVPVDWFCYPSGQYNATVIAAVRAAGFVGSTTVVPGWAAPGQDPYRLPRLRVLRNTTPSALLAQIAAARSAAAPPPAYVTS